MMGGGLLGLILIGFIVYWIMGGSGNFNINRNNDSSRKNALEILNERYARGEISEEEYQSKLKTLKNI